MLVLTPVIAPVIVAPALIFLPAGPRRAVLFIYLSLMAFVAVYLLSGAELESVTLLSSAFQERTGISFLSFGLHPYSRIAAFGFTLVVALGLLYGLEVASPADQAVALGALAGAVGVAFADNYLTLLFFWEVLTLTSTALIFLRGTNQAIRMAWRVLFLQLAGGLFLTVGIIMHYQAAGSFALAAPQAGLLFFILGIGVKAAFLPLHVWVPWGYPAAPFPSSVILAALCTKVGVYAVARVLPPGEGIALMGSLMAIVAVTFALLQHDLRRLLSFHIVSQVGYMIAGVGLGTYYGVDGGLLHLVNHMIYKALLFMSAGAVIFITGTEDMHDLNHPPKEKSGPALWRVIPIATAGAVVGALAISGTPLFNGYVSKYVLKKAAYGISPVETLLLVAGVGTSLSFAKFIYFGFIKARYRTLRLPTPSMQAAIVLSAASCIVTGVWPAVLENLLPYHTHLNVYSLSGVATALKIVGGGLAIFVLTARILERGIHTPALVNNAADWLAAALPRFGQTLLKGMDNLFTFILGLLGSLARAVYRTAFNAFQKLDYRPGQSKVFQTINISNIDFDIMLVIIIFGAIAAIYLAMTLNIQVFYHNPLQ
jgi:multicomponent Na+:H+ antiporter subunit D